MIAGNEAKVMKFLLYQNNESHANPEFIDYCSMDSIEAIISIVDKDNSSVHYGFLPDYRGSELFQSMDVSVKFTPRDYILRHICSIPNNRLYNKYELIVTGDGDELPIPLTENKFNAFWSSTINARLSEKVMIIRCQPAKLKFCLYEPKLLLTEISKEDAVNVPTPGPDVTDDYNYGIKGLAH